MLIVVYMVVSFWGRGDGFTFDIARDKNVGEQ